MTTGMQWTMHKHNKTRGVWVHAPQKKNFLDSLGWLVEGFRDELVLIWSNIQIL